MNTSKTAIRVFLLLAVVATITMAWPQKSDERKNNMLSKRKIQMSKLQQALIAKRHDEDEDDWSSSASSEGEGSSSSASSEGEGSSSSSDSDDDDKKKRREHEDDEDDEDEDSSSSDSDEGRRKVNRRFGGHHHK